MLYKIAHILRDHCGWLWELAEETNSLAFRMRYGSRMRAVDHVLGTYVTPEYNMRMGRVEDAAELASFFRHQPEADFEFFRPHGFDERTLMKLLRRTSFVMCIVENTEGQIVGYFFLRSFVHGVSYLGKMVDHEHQGQGIGKMMCKAAMDVAVTLGIRMFESINRKNMASMRSTGAVLKQVVLQELEHGDLLIEDLPLTGVEKGLKEVEGV